MEYFLALGAPLLRSAEPSVMWLNRGTVEYFVLWFRLSFSDRYAIWCSNDNGADYVLAEKGIVPCFSSIEKAEAFAKENQFPLAREVPVRHDLDAVKSWLRNRKERFNCEVFLAAWNLFGDFAAPFPEENALFEEKTRKYLREYEKLFYGNNLKAVRGRNPQYLPTLSREEIEHIAEIMTLGFLLLKAKSRQYA